MKYKKYELDSYTIHTIKTDKFKNCTMEIIFRNNIKKESITKWNFLCDMLMHSSKKFPKRKNVVIELENLYNSSLRGIPSRVGSSYLMSFVVNFLDPKYCDDGVLKDIIELPFEMILNPNITDEEFDLRSFNIIKNRTKADIEGIKEYATRYAFRRSLVNMDEESPASYSMSGYLEDLERITPSNLFKTYHEVLNTFQCDIYIVGNLDMDEVVRIIEKKFKNRYIKNYSIEMFSNPKTRNKSKKVIETGNYEQASLVMLYNLNDLTKYERDIVAHLYNFILGGGSLTTKLGKYLREDNSLCYSVSSLYQKYDKTLILYAGIDDRNFDLAVKLAKKAMNDMIKGKFSDQELEEAKLQLISSIKISQDNLGGILSNYLFHNLDDLPLYEERIEMFKKVTREDVIAVANKANLNIIYLLCRGDD